MTVKHVGDALFIVEVKAVLWERGEEWMEWMFWFIGAMLAYWFLDSLLKKDTKGDDE